MVFFLLVSLKCFGSFSLHGGVQTGYMFWKTFYRTCSFSSGCFGHLGLEQNSLCGGVLKYIFSFGIK